MRTETGEFEGDLSVQGDFILQGMVTGSVTVLPGAYLRLQGTIVGDLVVEAGGIVDLFGMVNGAVINCGELQVFGTVRRTCTTMPGGKTQIASGASVNAKRR